LCLGEAHDTSGHRSLFRNAKLHLETLSFDDTPQKLLRIQLEQSFAGFRFRQSQLLHSFKLRRSRGGKIDQRLCPRQIICGRERLSAVDLLVLASLDQLLLISQTLFLLFHKTSFLSVEGNLPLHSVFTVYGW